MNENPFVDIDSTLARMRQLVSDIDNIDFDSHDSRVRELAADDRQLMELIDSLAEKINLLRATVFADSDAQVRTT